ncbi:MAG: sigma-54-dependent Fis family transcriptional regulator [Legionellaceae bacterium]|nr:sigma-54-dependent Fis family transcriptional regulator [Legionellaceae bacterium]
MKNSILIVEDDPVLQEALVDILHQAGYECIVAENGQQALSCLQDSLPSLMISDIRMDKLNGAQLLHRVRRAYPGLPVLMMTAYAGIEDAVALMREGAVDYLQKPFDKKTLLERVGRYSKPGISDHSRPVVADRQSQLLLRIAAKVAQSSASVLISGESGTGKEVLARYIHDHSSRAKQPFIAINCAAIPEPMLEATLFGYEKGAFTGAYKASAGKFEQAQGGTILLDEVTEMSLDLQAKLLRVLQEREVERLGGQAVIPLDIRVIATTNRNLQDAVKTGFFREDLYFRLNVFPLQWRPLRERTGDILPLARYLITKHCQEKTAQPVLAPSAEAALLAYTWPGNARELDNVIQRALVLASEGTIEALHLGLCADGAADAALDWMQELCEGMEK